VYVIALGWPASEFTVESLGTAASTKPRRVENVQLLGTDEKVKWKQTAAGLNLTLPERYKPAVDYAAALKVILG
jgi:alpha-L-fucosidase